jgi:murein DD-endopeptidase MepM/ murein hydrolase activator NlpD
VETQERLLEQKEAEQVRLKAKVQEERAEVAQKTAAKQALATAALKDVKETERQLNAMEDEIASIASMLRRAQSRRSSSGGGGGSHAYSGSFGSGRWPVSGPITSPYGWRVHPITHTRRFHDGVDIGAGYGTPIHSAAAGTVVDSGWRGPYGQAIVVDHGSGIATMYGHCSSLLVSPGQTVSKGQVIGRVGSTGWSTGPHLHFTVFRNGSHVNPSSVF